MQDVRSYSQSIEVPLLSYPAKIAEMSNKIQGIERLLATEPQKKETLRFLHLGENHKKLKGFLSIFLEKLNHAQGELQAILSKLSETRFKGPQMEQVEKRLLTFEELLEATTQLTQEHVNRQQYSQLDDLPKENVFFKCLETYRKTLLEEHRWVVDDRLLSRMTQALTLRCSVLLHALTENGAAALAKELAHKLIDCLRFTPAQLSTQALSQSANPVWIDLIFNAQGSTGLFFDGCDIELLSGKTIKSTVLFRQVAQWPSWPKQALPKEYRDSQPYGEAIFSEKLFNSVYEIDKKFADFTIELTLLKGDIARLIIGSSLQPRTFSSPEHTRIDNPSPVIHRATRDEFETYAYEHRLDYPKARGSFRDYIRQTCYPALAQDCFLQIKANDLNLKGLNLLKADLSACDFRGADFTQATVFQVNFTEAIFDETKSPVAFNPSVNTDYLFQLQKEIKELLAKTPPNQAELLNLVPRFFDECRLIEDSSSLSEHQQSQLQEWPSFFVQWVQAYLKAGVSQLNHSLSRRNTIEEKQKVVRHFIFDMQTKLNQWRSFGAIEDCLIDLEGVDLARMNFSGFSFSQVKISLEQLVTIDGIKTMKGLGQEKLQAALTRKFETSRKLLTQTIQHVKRLGLSIDACSYLNDFACKGQAPNLKHIPAEPLKLCVLLLLRSSTINTLPATHRLSLDHICYVADDIYLARDVSDIETDLDAFLNHKHYQLASDLTALITANKLNLFYNAIGDTFLQTVDVEDMALSDLEPEQLVDITPLLDELKQLRRHYRGEEKTKLLEADQGYVNNLLAHLLAFPATDQTAIRERLETAEYVLADNPAIHMDLRTLPLTAESINPLNAASPQLIVTLNQFQTVLTSRQRLQRMDAFQTVIKAGDWPTTIQWLDAGLDVNAQASDGRTPLMDACFHGQVEMARLLLEKGAEPSATTQRNMSIIDALCLLEERTPQHLEVIDLLKAYGISPGFHSLIALGDRLAVQQAIESGEADVNRSLRGESALQVAAQFGHSEITALLLAKEANPSLPNHQGQLAIETACWHGQVEIVRLLFTMDFDVNRKDRNGRNLLYHVAKKGFRELAQLFIQYGANVDLDTAILLNRFEEIEQHLEQYPDKRDELLHLALDYSEEKTALWLIERGIGLHHVNPLGRHSLEIACEKNLTRVVKKLMEQLGEQALSTIQACKKMPLFIAVQKNNLDIARCLLKQGANPDFIEPGLNRSCLHQAIKGNQVEMLQLLLAYQANVGLKDSRGYLPLHAAAEQGNVAMVQCLVQSYYTARTSAHKTPLELLPKDATPQLVALLSALPQVSSFNELPERYFTEEGPLKLPLPIMKTVMDFVFDSEPSVQQQAKRSLPLVSRGWCRFYQQYQQPASVSPTGRQVLEEEEENVRHNSGMES